MFDVAYDDTFLLVRLRPIRTEAETMKRTIACLSGLLFSVFLLLTGCDESNLNTGPNGSDSETFTLFTTADGLADNTVNDMALETMEG